MMREKDKLSFILLKFSKLFSIKIMSQKLVIKTSFLDLISNFLSESSSIFRDKAQYVINLVILD